MLSPASFHAWKSGHKHSTDALYAVGRARYNRGNNFFTVAMHTEPLGVRIIGRCYWLLRIYRSLSGAVRQ